MFQAQTHAQRMTMRQQLQTLSKGSLSMLDYLERKRQIAYSLAENISMAWILPTALLHLPF